MKLVTVQLQEMLDRIGLKDPNAALPKNRILPKNSVPCPKTLERQPTRRLLRIVILRPYAQPPIREPTIRY
jgi:hypothetical protein